MHYSTKRGFQFNTLLKVATITYFFVFIMRLAEAMTITSLIACYQVITPFPPHSLYLFYKSNSVEAKYKTMISLDLECVFIDTENVFAKLVQKLTQYA